MRTGGGGGRGATWSTFFMACTVLCIVCRSYFSGRFLRRSISNVASCSAARTFRLPAARAAARQLSTALTRSNVSDSCK